jgi:SAM-dependent MidA family methyltransferase
VNQVAEKILQEVRNHGVISFARFMECALYCPVYGYYEKEEDTPGRRGDFFTSVSVGPLFGELLGLQFSEWLSADIGVPRIDQQVASPIQGDHRCSGLRQTTDERKMPTDSGRPQGSEIDDKFLRRPLQIVEAGAQNGGLARDILNWMRTWRPAVFSDIGYVIVEPSERRREWQRRMLVDFCNHVQWAKELSELSGGFGRSMNRAVRGVIFSNELLDSMPAHRLGWDTVQRVWFEWGVGFSDDQFIWTRLPNPTPGIEFPGWPEEMLNCLPDGFTIEVCPAAVNWWINAAKALEHGYLVTFDYGLTEEELLDPGRASGSLRAYLKHHLSSDLFAEPGQQDITAHVNFSALCRAGETAGLRTTELTTQERFLTRIAAPVLKNAQGFSEWTNRRFRQFQTLTHPNHLGRAFRVLVQSRFSGYSKAGCQPCG